MKILFLFLTSVNLFASQALKITSASHSHATTPAGVSVWTNVTDLMVEGCVGALVPTVGNSRLFDEESGGGLFTSTTGLEFRGFGGSTGPAFLSSTYSELPTITYFSYRFTRRASDSTEHLEVWDDQTGIRYYSTIADPNPGSVSFANKQIAPGSISGFVPAANAQIGCLRISNVILPINSAKPQRLLSTGFQNMWNMEFEGNLTDQSGVGEMNLTMDAGGTVYQNPILTFAPSLSLSTIPITSRAAESLSITISGSTNIDDPVFTCSVHQIGGAIKALFGNPGCSPTFTGPTKGQYTLVASILDSSGGKTSTSFTIGAVATDANGVTIVADSVVNALRGPQIRVGTSAYSRFDDRRTVAIDTQIQLLTTGGPNNDGPWRNQWSVASAGTVTLVNGSNVVTGSGTSFKALFCGGGTSPVVHTSEFVGWYASIEYATPGRGFYQISGCADDTHLTLINNWVHSPGTQTGRSYNMMDEFEAGYWTTYNTPGNYYDNISGYLDQYENTGLVKYLDAAITLGNNFWTGPFYDRGKNYDAANLGGTFIASCCGRSQSLLGLIRLNLYNGMDIWPGMHFIWAFNKISHDYYISNNYHISISDPRDAGYATAGWALCAQFDTDATWRTNCRTYLKDEINNLWGPLQRPSGEWNHVVNSGTYLDVGGGVYATVTTNSTAVVLTGSTWSTNNGTLGWFITDKLNRAIYPSDNSIGDSTYYTISSGDGVNLVLDRPYEGAGCLSGCQKGLITSTNLIGFGSIVYMNGIWGNQAGSIVYNALTALGDTAEATKARQFSIDTATWIATHSEAFSSSVHAIYYGANFFNCSPTGGDPEHCGAGLAINGEVLNNFALAYRFTGSSTIRNKIDEMMKAMWCKPTGGWTCPTTGYGTHMSDIDNFGDPGGYMINIADYASVKWPGFFFGYGKVQNVEAELLGGVLPVDSISQTTKILLPSNATKLRLTVLAPDGSSTITNCTGTVSTIISCTWSGDRREGDHQIKMTLRNDSDVIVYDGEYQSFRVR